MTIHGTVRNGRVELDDASALAEGQRVRIEPLKRVNGTHHGTDPSGGSTAAREPAIVDALTQWAGGGENLPEDLAANHDHYLYGTPRS